MTVPTDSPPSAHVEGVSSRHLSSTVISLLSYPLFWVLLATCLVVGIAAWRLAGQHELTVGTREEKLYLKEGFNSVEKGQLGSYRWTQPTAVITIAQGGPGPLTAWIRAFDAAPQPRKVRVSIDGKEVYWGSTQVGGVPWTITVEGEASAESPSISIETDPWNPPNDSRTLGIAFTGASIATPEAALRRALAEGALFVSVLALLMAAVYRTGHRAVAVTAAVGTIGIVGGMAAFGDVWLNRASGYIMLIGIAGAAWIILRTPHPKSSVPEIHPIETAPPWGTRLNWAPAWGAVAIGGVLLLITLGRFNTGDAEAMYQVSVGLVKDGVPWQHTNREWAHFGLGQSLVNIPLYLLGAGWAAITHANESQLAHFSVALLNQLITAATALVLFLGGRRRYGTGVALALVGTWLLTTPAIPYARMAFAEPLSGLLVLTAVMMLWVGPHTRRSAAATEKPSNSTILVVGFCLGLAVLVKPANGIYVPFTLLYLAWALARGGGQRSGIRGLLSAETLRRALPGVALAVAAMLPGLVLTGVFDASRYGHPLVTGYENEGFTTPLPVGLYGLLFSPGKGIIYFAPVVVLVPFALVHLWRARKEHLRAEVLWLAAQAALVFGFHALWSSWEGNIAWGPRFLVPFLPVMLWPLGALAYARVARWAWWVLGAGGFLVTIAGTLVDQFYYFDINGVYRAGTQAEWHMLFTPEWSQIVAHWRFLLTGLREPTIRPTLEQMGLSSGWDTVVPVMFAGLAVLGVVMALLAPPNRKGWE